MSLFIFTLKKCIPGEGLDSILHSWFVLGFILVSGNCFGFYLNIAISLCTEISSTVYFQLRIKVAKMVFKNVILIVFNTENGKTFSKR